MKGRIKLATPELQKGEQRLPAVSEAKTDTGWILGGLIVIVVEHVAKAVVFEFPFLSDHRKLYYFCLPYHLGPPFFIFPADF